MVIRIALAAAMLVAVLLSSMSLALAAGLDDPPPATRRAMTEDLYP